MKYKRGVILVHNFPIHATLTKDWRNSRNAGELPASFLKKTFQATFRYPRNRRQCSEDRRVEVKFLKIEG